MNKTIQRLTRWFLTLLLLREVYLETGTWTAIAIGMIFISIEVQGYITARLSALNAMLLSAYEPQPKEDKE